jgi:hypothetical protein
MERYDPITMYSWKHIEPRPLLHLGEITRAFLQSGPSDMREAAHLIQSLRYGRNSDPANPRVVLDERCGTCSTKHALMRRLADEQNVPMALTVGIYEMSERNTPGIGSVLKRFGLLCLPEAHCYLRVRGERIDLTGLPEAAEGQPVQHFLLEQNIEPEDITDYKVILHKRFLESWNSRQQSSQYSTQELWSIREKCILALSSAASA